MNSTRWAIFTGAVLSLGYAHISTLNPEGPSIAVSYNGCNGVRPVIALNGKNLPLNRIVKLYYKDKDPGLSTVGTLDLRTNQEGSINADILINSGREGDSFRLEVVGTDLFDTLLALTLNDGDLRRRIQDGRTLATVEGTIPQDPCRRERF